MGAWIETTTRTLAEQLLDVAPYMGAWIETDNEWKKVHVDVSLPIWERGLKPLKKFEAVEYVTVAPYMGAWIETLIAPINPVT